MARCASRFRAIVGAAAGPLTWHCGPNVGQFLDRRALYEYRKTRSDEFAAQPIAGDNTMTSCRTVRAGASAPCSRPLPALLAIVASLAGPAAAPAGIMPFDVSHSADYLIIALDREGGNTDVNVNNFELGANKAPVPSTGGFLDNFSTGGPTLLGAVPALPLHAAPVYQGIAYNGNIAITDPLGQFGLQDVGIYANPSIGIRVAGIGNHLNQSSNSFFNDPHHFPNTFNPATQSGSFVNANQAVQSTRIDPPGNGGFNAGVTYGFDFASLIDELDDTRSTIAALPGTGVLNAGSGGKISADMTFVAASGLNIIDILTGGNDFLIENSNLVIDGPADAVVIFRLPGSRNMNVSNANILIGNGGIGTNNVMFYTAQSESDTHFNFNNTIINGVAFWSLSPSGGKININNAQGCTQLIADQIDLDDVRFAGCQFIPEPGTLVLVLAAAPMALSRRRYRWHA